MKNKSFKVIVHVLLVVLAVYSSLNATVFLQDFADISSNDAFGGSAFVFRKRKPAPQVRSVARRAPVVARPVQVRNVARQQRVVQSVTVAKARPTPIATATPNNNLSAPEAVKTLLAAANGYLQNKDYENAEDALTDAAGLDPKNAIVKLQLVQTILRRGDAAYAAEKYEQALKIYSRAVDYNQREKISDALQADAYANLGDTFDALKQPSQAIAAYENALKINPDLTILNGALGTLYVGQNDFEKAAVYLKKATAETDANDVDLLDVYGLTLYKLDRNAEAAQILERARQQNSKSPETYLYLGEVYDRLSETSGDRDATTTKAIAAYNRAVELNPKFAEAFYDLGVAYFNRAQYPQAAENYKKALAIKGDYTDAQLNLAETYRQMEQYDDAVNNYFTVIGKKMNDAEILSRYGYCLGRAKYKNWTLATEMMTKAVALQPDATNYTNLAWADIGRKDYAAAKIVAQKAIELNPQFAPAYFNLGNAQLRNAQQLIQQRTTDANALNAEIKAAETNFTQALKYRQNWADAANNLGVVYGLQNDWKRAAEFHRRAIAAKPDAPSAHYDLGFAALMMKDGNTFLQEVETLQKLNPALADSLRRLGKVTAAPNGKDKKDKKNKPQ